MVVSQRSHACLVVLCAISYHAPIHISSLFSAFACIRCHFRRSKLYDTVRRFWATRTCLFTCKVWLCHCDMFEALNDLRYPADPSAIRHVYIQPDNFVGRRTGKAGDIRRIRESPKAISDKRDFGIRWGKRPAAIGRTGNQDTLVCRIESCNTIIINMYPIPKPTS